MSSNDKEKHPTDEAVTKNVIEYYKKYSQNPDLPKYFSGSSLSYLPEFRENIVDIPEIIIETNCDVAIVTEEKNELENVSRPSSAMSNRKLEWDYGADIGYDNCQNLNSLKKTNSLPIIRDFHNKDLIGPNELISKSSTSGIKSRDANIKFVVFNHSDSESMSPAGDFPVSSTTSTSVEEKKIEYLTTTSSSGNIKEKQGSISESSSKYSDSLCKKNISEFASTLSYLKKKIGLPDAQSTPQSSEDNTNSAQLITATPVSSEPGKTVGKLRTILSNYSKSTDVDFKTTNEVPSTSKDVNTKKRHRKIERKGIEKSTNLHFTKPVLVECISVPQAVPIKETCEPVKCASVAIQTDPNLCRELVKVIERHSIVQNQALEFCEHSDGVSKSSGTQTGSDMIEFNCNSFEYLKNVGAQNNRINRENFIPYSTSIKKQSSGDDISVSSSSFGDDIEENTNMLQKLLKSKKYDNSTKRRYIKKILQKIIESKYLEESSNSSEMFLPKRDTTGLKHLVMPPSTNSSSKSVQDSNAASVNTPCSQCHKISPRKRKPVKNVSTETKSVIFKKENEDMLEKFNVNKSSLPEPSNSTVENSYESPNSSSRSKHLSYQNWKEDKTYSEQLLEGNRAVSGDGDYFKEVAHQINRINNEIDNLGKLKNILENQDKVNQKKPKKVTSVYVVSDDDGKGKPAGKPKKYVIETNLGATLMNNRNFKIGDKRYNVTELTSASASRNCSDNSPRVLGDIEVVSSESTVNIKVTTFCEKCKRSPCVCTINKLNNNDKTNGSKSLAGTYINCQKTSDSAKATLPNIEKYCATCDLYNCKCSEGTFQNVPTPEEHLPKTSKTPESKNSSDYEYQSSGSGSLKKVFENCVCKSKSKCNCNFVTKLYEHFKLRNPTNTSEVKKDTTSVQTENILINTDIQTDIVGVNEMSQQTENLRELDSETTGIQCMVETRHASSQISAEFLSKNTQTPVEHVENIDTGISTLPKEEETHEKHNKLQSQYQQTDSKFPYENIEQNELLYEEKFDGNGAQCPGLKTKLTNGYMDTVNPSPQDKMFRPVPTINKSTQNTPSMMNSGTSSTAISPYENIASTTSSSTTVACCCCKKLTGKKHVSIYHYDNEDYTFCSKCIKKKPILTSICRTGPEHVCRCSSSEPDVSQKYCTCLKSAQYKHTQYCAYCRCKFRRLPSEPEKDAFREYCTCTRPSQYKNTQYCAHCQYKLRKTLKSKHGIAYTLTLECETPTKSKSKRKKNKELEEIRVKIPNPYSKKRHKDKENLDRQEKMKPDVSENYIDDTNDTTNKDSTIDDDKPTNGSQKSEITTTGENQSVQNKRILTLQEHLIKNRPDFIDSAEYRRHILLNSKQDRELNRDDIKIRFLEENNLYSDRPKLFTEREMRQITRNNYKKLPEVQQKLKNNRERVLRKADKFIVNRFTKKIQKSILKGKSSFPIDTHVIDVYK